MVPQDALFTKMEHITTEFEKESALNGGNILNKSKILPQKINGNVSRRKENAGASNVFKGDRWFKSALLLKNNRAAAVSKFFSFRRPLIGSVEQQNCVYSS